MLPVTAAVADVLLMNVPAWPNWSTGTPEGAVTVPLLVNVLLSPRRTAAAPLDAFVSEMVPLLTTELLDPTCRTGAVVLLVIEPALVTVAVFPSRTCPVIFAVESAEREIPLVTFE